MTPDELKQILSAMNPEQLEKFRKDFGSPDGVIRDSRPAEKIVSLYVSEFRKNPKHDARLCELLGGQTEQEKLAHATVHGNAAEKAAAEYARISAAQAEAANEIAKESNAIAKEAKDNARWATIWAFAAFAVALAALAIAVVKP